MSSSDNNNKMNRPNSIPFSPSIWKDYLMSNVSNNSLMDMKENNDDSEIVMLKKEVKKKIVELDYVENRLETLEFIDSIQRLGVSYYFENQIEVVLKNICNKFHEENNDDDDLYVVALRFRLVRQQGYYMSCDVFNKFTNNEGKFEESLCNDIRGMLSLYEASQLRVHGEKILDDALIFTTNHLESAAKTSKLSSHISNQVNHALKNPIRKSLQRRQARHYMSLYHQISSHNEHLLALAILDFNLLQKLYHKELSDFTRWDMCLIDELPEYIQPCYKEILNLYTEIGEFTKDKSYCLSYAKKGFQELVKGYFEEAKWLHQKHNPTLDEYMPIALVTAASPLLIAISFIGMPNVVTKDSMNWIFSHPQPKSVRTLSIVGRVLNDIDFYQWEERRTQKKDFSAVDCYIKQYGVEEEEAIQRLKEQVSDSWKDLNEECLYLNNINIPMPLLMRVLDLVRMNNELYREGDGFTREAFIKDLIDSLIINPYIQQ